MQSKVSEEMKKQALQQIKQIEAGEIVNKTTHKTESENRPVDHYNLRMTEELVKGKSLKHTLEQWEKVKQFQQSHKFKYVIFNGIGGSYLGSYLILTYLYSENYNDVLDTKIYFTANTDNDYFNDIIKLINLNETLIVTISKSGSTAETATNNSAFIKEFEKQNIQNIFSHFVAVTIEGSKLDQLAQQKQYAGIFHMNEATGGRTSICTAVSMICCAYANIDFAQFIQGMHTMDENTKKSEDNLALRIAGELIQYMPGNKISPNNTPKNYIFLFYSEFVKQYAHYCQQLYMESLGKEYDRNCNDIHTGLTVFGGVGTGEQHAFMQQIQKGMNDSIVKFLSFSKRGKDIEDEKCATMGRQLQAFLIGTQLALIKNKREFQHIQVQQRNEFCLGELIALEERVVTILACWLNINAYDQPGVQDGKLAATGVIQLSKKIEGELNTTHNNKTVQELSQLFNCEEFVMEGILIDIQENPECYKFQQCKSVKYDIISRKIQVQ